MTVVVALEGNKSLYAIDFYSQSHVVTLLLLYEFGLIWYLFGIHLFIQLNIDL